jgi:two-component system, OmpR family, sensor kinase
VSSGLGSAEVSLNRTEPHTTEALQGRIAELEEALRTRDELLSIAAHELRNPMHALLLQISAALQVARRKSDADIIRRLERLRYVVDRYVKRATVLLDACRMNAQRYELHADLIDLAAIVRDVSESYAAEAVFHHCELHFAVPERMMGCWDRLAMEQVVSNLLSNALKYGAGSTVEISLESEAGNSVRLRVRDGGTGIAPQDQPRIFDRFTQVAQGSERRGGTGLGLWIVRMLVEAHGGAITVASERGRGATFTVVLPRSVDSKGGAHDD